MKKGLLSLVLFYCLLNPLLSQQFPEKIASGLQAYKEQVLQEKIFVHTDRGFYMTGEYLWFKAYNVEGIEHRPISLSKVVYVELLNSAHQPVLQSKIPMEEGTGSGSLFLPASLPSGNYTFRAYTRWMRNFDPAFYFSKNITLVNPFKPLEASAQADSSAPSYDLQFFPEGGSLVNGLKSKVAFRVVDQNGKGIRARGLLLNEKGDTLRHFGPLKFGLGHFYLNPEPNQQYTVLLLDSLQDLLTKKTLPKALQQGHVMHLLDDGSEQLKISLTTNLPQSNMAVYLLAHNRQRIQHRAAAYLQEGLAEFTLDKRELEEGITHITLFDEQHRPICERLFFKRPEKGLKLHVQTERRQFSTREAVKLDLLAEGAFGAVADARLSLSVYRLDSLQKGNETDIATYLLLSSELKGEIESPSYYMQPGPEVEKAADHLMLTHGWRRFSWEDIIQQKQQPFKHLPDYRGQLVEARVLEAKSGKPAPEVLTYLSIPGGRFHFRGARSDQQGRALFELRDFYGQGRLILQTDYTRDSLYRIELLSPYSDAYADRQPAPLRISEKLEKQLLQRSINMQLNNIYFFDSTRRPLPPTVDSIAFYGKADEQYWLDDFTRFPVMEEVMREYVYGVAVQRKKKNFHLMVFNNNTELLFQENPLVLLDGVPVFDVNKIMAYNPTKVEKLEIIKRPYFYGPLFFKGILSYKTFEGDLPSFELPASALSVDYEGLQWKREFFAPVYELPREVRSPLPDFRDLLLWEPDIETDEEGRYSTRFFTSEQKGHYLILINGISRDGKAGSATLNLEVVAPVRQ